MNHDMIFSEFNRLFHREEGRLFFSPGRINLIGEHTDYNGGHVFPCAITLGTYGVAAKRQDQMIRLYSMNFSEMGMIEFSLNDLDFVSEHGWANYPKGVIRYLIEETHSIKTGMDLLIYGDIPNGAGLSSSASVELLMGVVLENLFELTLDRLDLVKIGKKVENAFIHVNSGIMDQFAIGMGKASCAMLLDCQTLEYSYTPVNLEQHQIIIMNTNKRRELADSKYNERRHECDAALAQLQKHLAINSLGDLTEDMFEQHKHVIVDETLRKRARHAVYENQRTLMAFQSLQNNDLYQFGQLMNASHASLRDDYQVTGMELDVLVDAAQSVEGVIGARMTGAGFGGCAIAIVNSSRVNVFTETVGRIYREKVGYDADFYSASIGAGARELQTGGKNRVDFSNDPESD